MPWAASTSAAVAKRKSAPSALRSLSSLSSWSPRRSTMTWRPAPAPPDVSSPSTVTTSAFMKARAGRPRKPTTCSMVQAAAGAGVVLRLAGARRRLDLAVWRLAVGAGQGHLDVGRVAALAAEDDLVLPGVSVGHVFVAHRAAHHARVALDHHRLDPAACVDAVVGGDVLGVALLQGLIAHVEAVRILHDELASAQHAALG